MIEGSRTRKLLQREKSIEEEIHHVSWWTIIIIINKYM